MTHSPLPSLPITKVLPALRTALTVHNRCLLVAQPGAGKTTRAPLALLSDFPPERGRWLLLEPRRVAARLAAVYMAKQLGEPVGDTVGYRVRGEQKIGPGTRLEVITQGILTRMIQDDPLLDGVAGIIFDEFHERGLEADLGLALALDVQTSVRDDLKLLVMSATLDVASLLAVLGDTTPVIDCPGRSWPVTTHHRPPQSREESAHHQARVVREALAAHQGNLLVFLPGQREIRRLQQLLASSLPAEIAIHPLHGQLTLSQQQEALGTAETDPHRRVILATAIAESSLTVPCVRVVVDAGLERVPVFQPRSGLTRLDTRRVNRASADQRRGRAGREAEGHCYRLWAPELPLAAHGEAEILQADLAGLAFELARWGVTDASALPWVTPPPAA
ncbi:MAG: helicase-related protein, partial [Porticoccaceae bacterium]